MKHVCMISRLMPGTGWCRLASVAQGAKVQARAVQCMWNSLPAHPLPWQGLTPLSSSPASFLSCSALSSSSQCSFLLGSSVFLGCFQAAADVAMIRTCLEPAAEFPREHFSFQCKGHTYSQRWIDPCKMVPLCTSVPFSCFLATLHRRPAA